MPISVELNLNGTELKLPDIGPLDPPGTFTHHDPEHPKLLVISCNPLDDGGLIYTASIHNQILLARGLLRVLVDDRDSIELEAAIGTGGSYERKLLTSHGLGNLMFRHYE